MILHSMLKLVQKVQMCDATGDAISIEIRNIKIFYTTQ